MSAGNSLFTFLSSFIFQFNYRSFKIYQASTIYRVNRNGELNTKIFSCYSQSPSCQGHSTHNTQALKILNSGIGFPIFTCKLVQLHIFHCNMRHSVIKLKKIVIYNELLYFKQGKIVNYFISRKSCILFIFSTILLSSFTLPKLISIIK